jgi:hypothetical protein
MQRAQSAPPAAGAVAKAAPDTGHLTIIVSASGSWIRSAAIRRPLANLKMPWALAKIANVRSHRVGSPRKPRKRRTMDSTATVHRFALAIRACPVLETRLNRRQRPVPCRSVAQLVEHRSPKPGVAGSSPATPASISVKDHSPRLVNLGPAPGAPPAVRRSDTLTFGPTGSRYGHLLLARSMRISGAALKSPEQSSWYWLILRTRAGPKSAVRIP